MSTINKFLVDDERRQAHRLELKRRLAELDVKRNRIAELREIVAKLNADSDAAANDHSEVAGELQAELDRLDADHIQALLDDNLPAPKAMQRRREILQQLSERNQSLELRCEANRRSAQPLEKQICELQMELALEGATKNKLIDLCSAELRRRKIANGIRLKLSEAALRDCDRTIEIFSHNYSLHELQGDEKTTRAEINRVRLEDYREVRKEFESALGDAHNESAELQRLALTE